MPKSISCPPSRRSWHYICRYPNTIAVNVRNIPACYNKHINYTNLAYLYFHKDEASLAKQSALSLQRRGSSWLERFELLPLASPVSNSALVGLPVTWVPELSI
jgi:hypothetical protein